MPPKGKAAAKAKAVPGDNKAEAAKRRRVKGPPVLMDAPQPPPAMVKSDVSCTLGYLKYHADPLKEKDPELLESSTKALATYAALGKIGKPEFLSNSNQTKKI